jgi:hypothetical protein
MKASSESGLCATVISRTELETLLPGIFAVSDTAVIMNSQETSTASMPQGLKPTSGGAPRGTAEAVPFPYQLIFFQTIKLPRLL